MLRLALLALLLACVSAHGENGPHRHGRDDRLFVLGNGVIQQYSLSSGEYLELFASKESTNGIIWGTDSIAQKDNLLYIGTYYSDPTKSEAGPGAIQIFTKSGKYVRRFDSVEVPLRPYGLKFASIPPAGSNLSSSGYRGGRGYSYGGRRRDQLQLLVSGLGNDAVLMYDGKSGRYSGTFTQGDNTTASAQGPNDLVVVGRTLFLTTEGSIATPDGQIIFPSYLQSALLAINIDTRQVTLAAVPTPAPNAGFVSLLGVDLIPASDYYSGSSGSGPHGYRSDSDRHGSGGSGKEPPVLLVSDFAGGLRYYKTTSPYELLKTVDTSFIDPTTQKLSTLYYGHVRVVRNYIYLAAYNNSSPGSEGLVLRYTLDGTPAGKTEGPYAGTPVWIEPSDKIPRAIGLELVKY